MFDTGTKWIWINKKEENDEYASFLEKYSPQGKEKIILKIAAETNYIAYVNGKRVAFGQFPGYKEVKYYDEIDITEASSLGENELRIVVRYEGIDTLVHVKDNAGLIFEVTQGEDILCRSSKNTMGGLDMTYQQNVCRNLTWQVGYSSDMNSCGEVEKIEYAACRETNISENFLKRPVKKLVEEPFLYGLKVENSEKEIYDFGKETAGYIVFRVWCEKECDIVLAYGEHLADGCVRQIIQDRDFSLHFHCRPGENVFEQLFVRVAGRYVEIFKPEHAKVESVAIMPVMYPIDEKEHFLTGLDEKIYETCVRTLKLCMHEHYEDCPWREQALYIVDSRNQMLCGYYAFHDSEFARANIVYISKGVREDGLLELTFPAVNTPAIPFFCIMYPVVVWEYVEHTKDMTILEEVMPVVKGIMEKFKSLLNEKHLIFNLPEPYWNFYEWSEGSMGYVPGEEWDDEVNELQCDLILNCAFVYAAERYQKLCQLCGEHFEVDLEEIKRAISQSFYDKEKGMYFLSDKKEKYYSQLGNAFAKLIGLEGEHLIQAVRGEGNVVPATLSMKAFVYDALIEDEVFIFESIRADYGHMLSCGATSFWETIKGEADFDGAGSLCHGWSTMPIYYYNKLLRD